MTWGGGSVSLEDEPVDGAVNLSCRQLHGTNHDVFNTSFVHASCLVNKLLDISGFRLGRRQLGEKSKSVSKESAQPTSDTTSVKLPSSDNESTPDVVLAWLKNTPSIGVSNGKGEKEENEISMASASTIVTPIYEAEGKASLDSVIWPDDSASAVKPNFTGASPEGLPALGRDQDERTSLERRTVQRRIQKWLDRSSSENSDDESE
ncbi:uncharacterized protein [Hetaerina americana]|uniref:uncharacterized protein n=1 Tax=Hetaerina americana TaxID=62018 RepID=UPI003A7F26C8